MKKLRSSIADLMLIVAASAVALAALHDPSYIWAGITLLTTYTILGLGIVGAIYRRGERRAWWLGFCVFAWGYLALSAYTSGSPYGGPQLPTIQLLLQLKPALLDAAKNPRWPMMANGPLDRYIQIGHALWSMLAGLAGGLLARLAFGSPADQPAEPAVPPPSPPSSGRSLVLMVVTLSIGILACVVLAVRPGTLSDACAGAAFFLTGGLLGLAALAAIFGRGRRRQAAIGAVVFGAGYLFLVFARAPYQILPPGQAVTLRSVYQPIPTSSMLEAARGWTVGPDGARLPADARILRALELPVTMTFPEPTALEDVLRYVTLATATPDGPGIPIYLDPIGLQEVERTPQSTIEMDLMGVPLRTTLRLALAQLGLRYYVSGGCLRVTSGDTDIDPFIQQDPERDVVVYSERWNSPGGGHIEADAEDAFLIAGHCLLAVLAMGFGAIAAPRVAGAAGGRISR